MLAGQMRGGLTRPLCLKKQRDRDRERERTTNPVRACVQRGSDRGSFWLCGRREGERERERDAREREIWR